MKMLYLSWILLYFEALFGLRVNLEKSVILPVGNVENLNQLASELGLWRRVLPSTYLGLSFGSKLNSISVLGKGGLRKKLEEEDLPLGRDSISRKGEDIRSLEVRCLICLFTSYPFSGCLRVSKVG